MSSLLALSLFTSLFLGPAGPTTDEPEWPSWRGPSENGHAAADARPPLTWSEEQNIRYKVELPGLGCSSPVICGERLYLTTAIDLEALGADGEERAQPGPPNADHRHAYFVLALDRGDGSELWRTKVGENTPHSKGHTTGSHASPTIQTDGERLVCSFGSTGLFVLDMDGAVKWSKDFGDMKVLADFGEGSTPALHGDTVVVQWDEEGPSFVAAFDVDTGEEFWRTPRDVDSSWGSPLVTEVDDTAQVILTGSDATVGYELESGEELWRCSGMSKNPVNSPTVADGTLFVMNSYKGRIVQAIRLAGASGELNGTEAVQWAMARDPAYVPPPIVHEGRLYHLRDSTGTLNCTDAATGEEIFKDRLPEVKRIHSSPLLAGDRLYFSSREGTTVVVRAGTEYEVLATNQLDDVFDATAAIVGDAIYLRGRSHLYCIAED